MNAPLAARTASAPPPVMHRKIGSSLRSVACQFGTDLLGKEVQTGFTVSYTWIADQGGHILIGFLGSVTLGGIVRLIWEAAPLWAALAPSALLLFFIVFKEVKDYLKDRACKNPQGLFQLDLRMLLWNAVTATIIMLGGVAIGMAVLYSFRLGAVAAIGVLVATGLFAWWWIPQKVAFQNAGLPFIFRLGNVSSVISTLRPGGSTTAPATIDDGRRLAAFCTPNGDCGNLRHVIVLGSLDSGKTSFGVALGTEFALSRGYARYLSFARLLEGRDDLTADEPIPHQGRMLWRWPHCDLVMIDDVDVAIGAPARARGAKRNARTEGHDVREALKSSLSPDEQRALGAMRTVWLICDGDDEASWRDTLGAYLRSISPPVAGGEAEVMVLRLDPGPKTFQPKPCFR
ncbi:MAG: hypothetical protein U1F37_20415 [Alphaproteobacteria bacterium]